jgi:CheY-like chemotaxis protein
MVRNLAPKEGMRVLVVEPNKDVRDLHALYLTRIGCTPVLPGEDVDLDEVDVILLEPASRETVALCEAVGPRIVYASVYPRETFGLGTEALYLVKPFGLPELHAALAAACTSGIVA